MFVGTFGAIDLMAAMMPSGLGNSRTAANAAAASRRAF